MRVLHVIHQDPKHALGGSETYCRNLMAKQNENDITVGVFYRCNDEQVEPFQIEQGDGITYYCVNLALLPSAKHRFQYENSYANPHVLPYFEKALEDFAPDVIHIHHLITLNCDMISLARSKNIPVALTLHDYWYFCHRITLTLPKGTRCSGPSGGTRCRGCGKEVYNRFPGKFLQPGQALASVKRNRRLMKALGNCDLIYAPSHALIARYENEGLTGPEIVHRPYGILKTSGPRRNPDKPVTFGFIGQLAFYKGPEVLIDAARFAADSDYKIMIYGEGEPEYEAKLRKKAKGLAMEFVGRFDPKNLHAILAKLDVLVVPSLWEENSPLVIHEAAASRLPVIASNIGGLPEIVGKGHGGLLFDAGDSSGLGKIIADLSAHPIMIRSMSAKTRVIRTLERDVEETLSDYCALTKKNRESAPI